MSNINRDYLIILDVKSGEVDSPNIYYFNTDKNTSNLYTYVVEFYNDVLAEGKISDGKSILVVPVINPCSMNIEKRFCPQTTPT